MESPLLDDSDYVDDGDSSDSGESLFDLFTGVPKDTAGQNELDPESKPDASKEGDQVRYDIRMREAERELNDRVVALSIHEKNRARMSSIFGPQPPGPASSPYRYKTLVDREHFRLLDMLPAYRPNATLRAQMIEFTGSENYQVVSYYHDPTWEAHGPFVRLECEAKFIQVPSGLYDMIRAIRNHIDGGNWNVFKNRPSIFVEAVCVNPGEPAEQFGYSSQAATVVKKAAGTIIYLGSSPDHSESSQVLDTAAKIAFDAKDNVAAGDQTPVDLGTDSENLKNIIAEVFRSPWFTQRDLLHDLCHARRTIVWGSAAINAESFGALLSHLDFPIPQGNPFRDLSRLHSVRPNRWLLAHMYNYRHARCGSSLTSRLLGHRADRTSARGLVQPLLAMSCGCRLAHEKSDCQHGDCGITSFSTLLSDEQGYNKPAEDVFIELAKKALDRQPVALLALACVFPPGKSSAGLELPSWTPDWYLAYEQEIADINIKAFLDRCFGDKQPWETGSSFVFAEEMTIWKRPEDFPGLRSVHSSNGLHEVTPMEKVVTDFKLIRGPHKLKCLKLEGWILERPGTRPSVTGPMTIDQIDDIDWRKPYMGGGEAIGGGGWGDMPAIKWYDERTRLAKSGGDKVQVVFDEWPQLTREDKVLFIPGCQLMFVLRESPVKIEAGCYRLVSFFRRNTPVEKVQFVYVDASSGMLRGYAHLQRELHRIDLV